MRYRIIQTAGSSIVVFRDWGAYKRFFNANSGIVMMMPNMNTA